MQLQDLTVARSAEGHSEPKEGRHFNNSFISANAMAHESMHACRSLETSWTHSKEKNGDMGSNTLKLMMLLIRQIYILSSTGGQALPVHHIN